MQPTLEDGRIVIGLGWAQNYRVGDIVIFRHKNLEKIKRIYKVTNAGVEVRGDNQKASTDSRAFGIIPKSSVDAKIVCKLL